MSSPPTRRLLTPRLARAAEGAATAAEAAIPAVVTPAVLIRQQGATRAVAARQGATPEPHRATDQLSAMDLRWPMTKIVGAEAAGLLHRSHDYRPLIGRRAARILARRELSRVSI